MISFKNSTLPLKFNNFFSMKNQIHSIIIQGVLNLFVYRYIELINTRRCSVYFQGPKFYNSLNAKITKSSSYASFEKELKEFLFARIHLKYCFQL